MQRMQRQGSTETCHAFVTGEEEKGKEAGAEEGAKAEEETAAAEEPAPEEPVPKRQATEAKKAELAADAPISSGPKPDNVVEEGRIYFIYRWAVLRQPQQMQCLGPKV